MENTVCGLSSAQLVTFLTRAGISGGGVDSVWEKEVTGNMLCQFCEEDIKDVFIEFKDRFLIRKLLRDITDKQPSRQKPTATQAVGTTNSSQLLTTKQERQSDSFHSTSAPGASHSQMLVPLPSISGLPTGSQSHVSKRENGQPAKSTAKEPHTVIDLDENDSDSDTKDFSFYAEKKLHPKLLPASVHGNPYLLTSSGGGKSLPPHLHCVDRHTSPYSAYQRSDHTTSHTAHHTSSYAHYAHNVDDRWKSSASAQPGRGEQALCLKKIQSSTSGMPAHGRNDTASPVAQPSSTTPDMTSSEMRMGNVGNASVMAMSQMASRHTAYEILSKKEQRSRPNSAQKLGSILIRNAAQNASMWSSPPHLRNISPMQKQLFLDYIYQVAPHLRECEALLWQRLSETLQNRRKYLLDKRLGKRGVSTSSSDQNSTYSTSVVSSDSLQDLSWTLTTNPDFESLKEVSGGEESASLEAVLSPQNCPDKKKIKIEKD